MDNKIIALIIIILLVLIGGFYVFSTQTSANNNLTINNTNNTTQTNPTHTNNVKTIKTTNNTNNTNQNSTPKVKISPEQAQINAVGAEKELSGNDVFAGKPDLFKWTANNKHTWVYNVNLYDIKTKKSVGALYVDAMNGEIIMNE
ncbi:hypothetical protein [Methanobacterium sp.]|uniref:hypothetical protein n=1 Tax=Methanobacterium sp. TaxID=2164 RepID=UPI003C70C5B0